MHGRKGQTNVGDVRLKVPKSRPQTFATAIIEWYLRRESSMEETLIGIYLAGDSFRRVEDITETLSGSWVSPGMVSNLSKKRHRQIEAGGTGKSRGVPHLYFSKT